ncbi:MAG: hypothetical protein IIC87_07665 [Chloroflexi bacterium]|nr:hypothetical protein [Chloroflexota bacterium]
MIRRWRRGLVLAAVGAAIVGGVLLATRPWSGETPVEQAAASPAEYGICNVSVSDIPPDVRVSPLPFPTFEGSRWQPTKSGEAIFLVVSIPLPDGERPTVPMSRDDVVQSNAVIDAATGEVIGEGYLTPADETKIKAVLATLRVGPWEPAGPAWPRTDTTPNSEIVEIPKPLRVASDYNKVSLKYRQPEAGSGMIAGRMSFATMGDVLRAYTCDSIVEIDGETGAVLRREVVAEEQAMFQRFLNEVVVP